MSEQQPEDETDSVKVLTLKQVRDRPYHGNGEDLHDVEEGERVGNFLVTNVEERECDHNSRKWSVEEQISEDTPTMLGKCLVCGDEKRINSDE